MMSNTGFCLILGLTFVLTLSAILVLWPIATRMGLTDQPGARKLHQGEIPLIGGLAIFLSILAMQGFFGHLNFAYLLAAALIVIAGVADDYKNISIKARLITEITAALIMVNWGGAEIKSVGNLLGFGEIRLGLFSVPFTVFAIVGGINAFNMIDGIDGLAGSLSLMVFIVLLILGFLFDNANLFTLCSIFIPAIVAFLLFNLRILGRKSASIFLGDTGSTFLGFTICWLIISVTQGEDRIISPVTVLWIIAVPLFDTVSIAIRRVRNGRSPFAPDRGHFHYVFSTAGYGVNQTLAVILLFAIIMAIVGWVSDLVFRIPEWYMFYLFLGCFSLYHWSMCCALASYPLRNIQRFTTNEIESTKRLHNLKTEP